MSTQQLDEGHFMEDRGVQYGVLYPDGSVRAARYRHELETIINLFPDMNLKLVERDISPWRLTDLDP